MGAQTSGSPNYQRMKKAELIAALQLKDKEIAQMEADRGRPRSAEPDLVNALEHIDDGFILYDSEERLLHCNDRILEFYNFTHEDVAGETTAEDLARLDMRRNLVLHEDLDDDAYVAQRLEQMRAGDRTTLVPLKDDRWIEARDRHLPDGGIVSIHRDISHRMEEVNVQKRLLDSIPVCVGLISRRSGKFLYGNPAIADVLGLNVEDLVGFDVIKSYVNPDDRKRYIAELDEQGQVDEFEAEFQDVNGNRFWVLLSSRLIEFQGEAAILASLFVINRRKRAEDALLAAKDAAAGAEARMIDAIENVSEGFALFDKDQRIVLSNSNYRNMYGYTVDDVTPGTTLDSLIQQDIETGVFGDASHTAEEMNRRTATYGETGETFDVPLADGRWIQIRDRHTTDGGTVSIHADVTELKRTEEALQANKALLTAFLDNASSPMLVKDLEGRYLLANKAFADNRGMSQEEMIGKTAHELFPEDVAASFELAEAEVKKSGKRQDSEVRVRKADGKEHDLLMSRFPVFTAKGTLIAIGSVSTDITERKRAEEELAEKEALLRVALDNMPGGIRLVDKDRRNVLFNARYSELFDFPEDLMKVGESVLAENIFQAARGEFGEGDPETLAREWLKSLKSFDEPTNWERRTESGRILDCRTQPTELGGYVSIITDITERKKVEQALRKSEATIKSFLDHANVLVIIKDTDLRYIMINKAFADERGLAPDEIIGKTPADLQPSDLAEKFMATDRQVMETGETLETESYMFNAAGEKRYYFTTKYPVLNDEGETVAIGSMMTDITERRRVEQELIESKELLEKTEARMIDSIESISDAFIHYDADERLVYCNEKNKDFFPAIADHLIPGARLEDVIRVAATDGVDFEAAEDIEEYVQNRLSDFRSHRKNREQHLKDGRWVLCSEYETQEGGIVGVRTEITEQKKAEKVLRQAKEQAEALADAKSDFVAVVSHEVRTPMNGVLGMARLMLDTELNGEQREFSQAIVDSGEALLTILNDLLDISKLEAGKLELENVPFALARAAEDAAMVMAAGAEEVGLSLSCAIADDLPDVVVSDPHRLRQVLLNLVSNAVKFTSEGSISVTGEVVTRTNDTATVAFSVTDTGAGISEEAKAKLFSPYTQGSVEIARKYGGTGLGLAICRRIADLMGGSIELESELGKGSTFRLIVPFAIADDAALAAITQDRDAQDDALLEEPLDILLVEDNEINRRVALGMLHKHGHRVEVAVNGTEALERLKPGLFDVILMDRHMPVMGGIATTRHIRAMDGEPADIPIIGVTAAANTQEIEACLAAGMDACVTKPIDPAVLNRTLARVMSGEGGDDPAALAATPANTETSKDAPVFDTDVLEGLREDYGDEMLISLVDDFREICSQTAADLETAAIEGDAEQLQRTAHDLKSNARTMGLMKLAEHCWEIESHCIANRFNEAETMAGEVAALMREGIGLLEGAVAVD